MALPLVPYCCCLPLGKQDEESMSFLYRLADMHWGLRFLIWAAVKQEQAEQVRRPWFLYVYACVFASNGADR